MAWLAFYILYTILMLCACVAAIWGPEIGDWLSRTWARFRLWLLLLEDDLRDIPTPSDQNDKDRP